MKEDSIKDRRLSGKHHGFSKKDGGLFFNRFTWCTSAKYVFLSIITKSTHYNESIKATNIAGRQMF